MDDVLSTSIILRVDFGKLQFQQLEPSLGSRFTISWTDFEYNPAKREVRTQVEKLGKLDFRITRKVA